MSTPNYQRAKQMALGILEDFGIDDAPVNPLQIAKDLGMKVFFVKMKPPYGDKVSGFYDAEENAIFVNDDEYGIRKTFTAAHELGHKMLHEEWVKSSEYKVLLRESNLQNPDFREKEANAFAANLLVPRKFLDRYWEKMSVSDLSRLFCVSVPVIKYRLAFEYGI